MILIDGESSPFAQFAKAQGLTFLKVGTTYFRFDCIVAVDLDALYGDEEEVQIYLNTGEVFSLSEPDEVKTIRNFFGFEIN